MRYSTAEKAEIIDLVQQSHLSIKETLRHLDIGKSTFYNWLKHFYEDGIDGLEDKKHLPGVIWNKIPDEHSEAIIQLALTGYNSSCFIDNLS